METNPKLEAYLLKLDRALAPLSASDRAEIVLEIKSHIVSARERDPQQPVEAIMAALGAPESVASKYLLERGRAPVKPPISPVVKWLVIGLLGTFGFVLILLGALFWKFSPLIHVDGKHDHVKILGGLIDVDGELGDFGGASYSFSGRMDVDQAHRKINISFSNGKLSLRSDDRPAMTWDCRTEDREARPKPMADKDSIGFDMAVVRGVRCELTLPKGAQVSLDGKNGKVMVDQPLFNLDLRLMNGKLTLNPVEGEAYRYDLSVINGKIDDFSSSEDPKALSIKARLTNGKISREE
jgi:hypothetical protein